MKLTIANIQYHPNAEAVAVLCDYGLGQFYVNLKQSALPATWGDADILSATQAVVTTDPQYRDFAFVVGFPEAENGLSIAPTPTTVPVG